MLVDSSRLTAADRVVWARLEEFDRRLSADPRLELLAGRGRAVIEAFADAGPCYASVSWGRDSVIVAYLVATSAAAGRVPLWYASSADVPGRAANPESPRVRDVFLAAFPGVVYYETGRGLGALDGLAGTPRRITGVRGAESGLRRRAMRWHGDASVSSARPIGRWTHEDVFAGLFRWGLPVHPAYAMSEGGVWERRFLRVHSIGGCDGGDRGRIEWEDRYFPDVTEGLRGWTAARPG